MINPLLPKLLISVAIAGVAAFSAWRAAREFSGHDELRYRPRRKGGFGHGAYAEAPVVVERDAIARTRDALSGALLDPDAEIFRCAQCQSFYSVTSVRALAADNAARCISCGSIERIPVQVVARR